MKIYKCQTAVQNFFLVHLPLNVITILVKMKACVWFSYILSRENDAKLQVILSSLLDHRLLEIEWIEKCHNPLFWSFNFPDGQSEVPEFW